MMAAKWIQVTTTIDAKRQADKMAQVLLQKKLAACVQIIGPIKSRYWWRKKIETAQEWLLVIKSKSTLFSKIEKNIKALHPYIIPEIIAMPIVTGSKDYLQWMKQEHKRA